MFGFGETINTFWLGGAGVGVPRPVQPTTSGMPIDQLVDIDPIWISRPQAGPVRSLLDADEAYKLAERE